MSKNFKNIIKIFVILAFISSLSACAEKEEPTVDGGLLTGDIGGDFIDEKPTVTTEIIATASEKKLYKEKNPELNNFYYGPQVPIDRFSVTSSADGNLTEVSIEFNKEGNISLREFKLYIVNNPVTPIAENPKMDGLNKVTFENIENVEIAAGRNLSEILEIRVNIEETNEDVSSTPNIEINSREIVVSRFGATIR